MFSPLNKFVQTKMRLREGRKIESQREISQIGLHAGCLLQIVCRCIAGCSQVICRLFAIFFCSQGSICFYPVSTQFPRLEKETHNQWPDRRMDGLTDGRTDPRIEILKLTGAKNKLLFF